MICDSEGRRQGDISVGDGYVESTGEVPVGEDEVYSLDGLYVAPGVVDCHVHLTSDGDPDSVEGTHGDVESRVKQNLRRSLEAGVVGVRDLNAASDVVIQAGEAVEADEVDGARVKACGRALTTTGGHFHEISRVADGAAEFRKAAREQLADGADVLKCMATASAYHSRREGGPEMTLDELEEVVKIARMHGVPVAAHAEAKTGVMRAIRAGVTSVEHGKYIDREAARELSETKTYWVPTAKATEMKIEHEHGSVERARKLRQGLNSSFRHCIDAGVSIAMGSDAGTAYNRHGENLEELRLMAEHGMSPEHVLEASTRTAAQLAGFEDLGMVREGYRASFVVLEEDPLESAEAWTSVATVMADGRWVDGPP